MAIITTLVNQNKITNNELEGIARDDSGNIYAQTPAEGSQLYTLNNNLDLASTQTFGNDWADDIGFNKDTNSIAYFSGGLIELYALNGDKIQTLNVFDAQGPSSQPWEGMSEIENNSVFLVAELGDIYKFDIGSNTVSLVKENSSDFGLVTGLSQYGSISAVGYNTGMVYLYDSETGVEENMSIALSGAGALEDIVVKDFNTVIGAYGTGEVATWETTTPIPETSSFGIVALALGLAMYKKFKR